MASKKRSKIKYCLEDYLKTVTDSEKKQYEDQFRPLIEIILSSADDDEVMGRVREFDSLNNSDFFSEVIKFKIYCIVCHRVDCIC